ncbi:SulP family inorganic anion transporter [Streptomyces sp. NPDC001414]
MTGFSTGIALQIVTGVLKDATGYRPRGHNRLQQLADRLAHIGRRQLAATLVAVATIAVWALARAVPRLEPVALLVAMAVSAAAAAVLGTDVEHDRDIAHIPAALPGFSAPDLSAVPHLFAGAVAVALVAPAQAASIGSSVPNPDGSRSSVNGDLAAQGLANLAGGLFQALPSGGSLSRTGVAVSAGARTRWAGVLSGVLLALVVLVCAPLAEAIPMPVTGGLILVVGGELIWGKRAGILLVLRTSRLSSAAMAPAFLATTQLPLQQVIVLGAVLSLPLYCAQAARQARFQSLTRDPDGRRHLSDPPARLPPGEVTVLHYGGTSFFAELPRIEQALPRDDDARKAVLVLVLRGAPDVPSSSMLKVIRRHARELDRAGRPPHARGRRPGPRTRPAPDRHRPGPRTGRDRPRGGRGVRPGGPRAGRGPRVDREPPGRDTGRARRREAPARPLTAPPPRPPARTTAHERPNPAARPGPGVRTFVP